MARPVAPPRALLRAALLVLTLLATALAGCTGPAADPGTATGGDGVGPDWRFVDTEGETRSRDDALGNASVLFFMATWCASCRALAPKLASLEADHREQGLQLYTVTIERNDDDAKLEAWKERYAQPWPHGRDPTDAMLRTFQIVSQSSIVVLDPDGQVVRKWSYPGPSEEALRAAVEQALPAGGAGAA